jgi:hypothetical protein
MHSALVTILALASTVTSQIADDSQDGVGREKTATRLVHVRLTYDCWNIAS